MEDYEKVLTLSDLPQKDILKCRLYSTIGNHYSSGIWNDYINYDKALEYYLKALEIRKRVLGEEHPDTADSFDCTGSVYCKIFRNDIDIFNDLGDDIEIYENEKALDCYSKALDIRKKIFGIEHYYTALSYRNIGELYFAMNDYDKAIEYYMTALEIQKKVMGTEHPSTANTYKNIGDVYFAKKKYNQVLKYLKKAMQIKQGLFGEDHLDTATSYDEIGKLYIITKDYDKALEYYMKANAIREKIFGENHIITAESYNELGRFFLFKHNYDKAFDYFFKSINIREKILKKGNPNIRESLKDLGFILLKHDKPDKALVCFMKAQEFQEMFGKDYSKSTTLYNIIAWTLHLLDRNEEALPNAEKAVTAFPNNPNIIDTLATVYQGLGRYDEAMEQFELCLKLKKVQGASEDSIHETEEKIEDLKKMLS